MTVLATARRTTTDVLTTVSATTGALTHAAESVSALAEAGSLHAKHYRDVTKLRLDLTREEYQDIAESQAKLKIARAVHSINQELAGDPALEEIYNSISFSSSNRPVQLQAAE